MGAAAGAERDEEALLEIAERFNTTPEELIEGTSGIDYDRLDSEKASRAQLCRCPSCGDVMGCEHDLCPECR